MKTLAEVTAYRRLSLKSMILEDSQIINSSLKGIQKYEYGVSQYEMWGLEKSPCEICIDLSQDNIVGSFFKKHATKEDCIFKINYTSYILK